MYRLALAIAFVVLSVLSWRRGPDLLIDFGHEAYSAWQLSQGQQLYRDLAWHFGPLSQSFDALVFATFGSSLTSLFAANLAILAVVTALVWQYFATACDRLTAFLCSLTLLALFGFAQYLPLGNYNWISPYCHEMTHGVALLIAMCLALVRWERGGRTSALVGGGLALGAVLLTKTELSLAGIATAAASFVAGSRIANRQATVGRLRSALIFSLSAIFPAATVFVGLAISRSPAEAMRVLVLPWRVLLHAGIENSSFQRETTGLDEPLLNLGIGVVGCLVVVLCLAGLAVVARGIAKRLATAPALATQGAAALVAAAVAALLTLPAVELPWPAIAKGLPLFCVLTGAFLALRLFLARQEPSATPRWHALLVWSVLSLTLLGRVLLNVRIFHYGFALAMPATLLLVAVGAWQVPRWAAGASWPQAGSILRATALAVVLCSCAQHLRVSLGYFAGKTQAVGDGGDQIWVEAPANSPRVAVALRILDWVEHQTQTQETLLVLPQGLMINYLARRRMPIPYENFNPFIMPIWGGDEMLGALQRTPPDHIVVTEPEALARSLAEFPPTAATGRDLGQWLRRNYRVVADIREADQHALVLSRMARGGVRDSPQP